MKVATDFLYVILIFSFIFFINTLTRSLTKCTIPVTFQANRCSIFCIRMRYVTMGYLKNLTIMCCTI